MEGILNAKANMVLEVRAISHATLIVTSRLAP